MYVLRSVACHIDSAFGSQPQTELGGVNTQVKETSIRALIQQLTHYKRGPTAGIRFGVWLSHTGHWAKARLERASSDADYATSTIGSGAEKPHAEADSGHVGPRPCSVVELRIKRTIDVSFTCVFTPRRFRSTEAGSRKPIDMQATERKHTFER